MEIETNFTFNPVVENINKICMTPKELTDSAFIFCNELQTNKPITFLLLAFVIALIENLFSNAYRNNEKIFFQSKFFTLSSNDILSWLFMLKMLFLALSILFIAYGTKIITLQ